MDIESVHTVQNASSSTVGGKSFQSKAKGFIAVKTFASLTQAIRTDLAKITFVYFYAGWHPESLSILQELQEISEGYLIDCNLVSLDTAEEGNFEICHKLGVDFVPKGFLITPDLQVVESLEVNDVNTTFDLVERQILLYKQNFEIEKVRATTKIQTLLSRHQAVLLIDEHSENNSLHSELLKHNLKVPVHNVSVGEAGSGNENPVNLKR